jgi:hypothetical protein
LNTRYRIEGIGVKTKLKQNSTPIDSLNYKKVLLSLK